MNKRLAILAELPRLRRYARALLRDSALAEDLVHDCVAQALAALDSFRDGTNMSGWLLTIMHNLHVNGVRRHARTPVRVPLEADGAGHPSSAPDQGDRLAVRDLSRALQMLSEDQRSVVLLVGLENMSYKEAAAVLGVPVGTVMSRLARGRGHLRRLMDGDAPPSIRRVK